MKYVLLSVILLALPIQKVSAQTLSRADQIKQIKTDRYNAIKNFIASGALDSAAQELLDARLELTALAYEYDHSVLERVGGLVSLQNLSADAAYAVQAQKLLDGILPGTAATSIPNRVKAECSFSGAYAAGSAVEPINDFPNRSRRIINDSTARASGSDFCMKALQVFVERKCRQIRRAFPTASVSVSASALVRVDSPLGVYHGGDYSSSCPL